MPGYQWDNNVKRFRNPKGQFISQIQIRNLLNIAIDAKGVVGLTSDYKAGLISQNTWHQAFRVAIKNAHLQAGMLAKGGRQNMTAADWGKIGGHLAEQYYHLDMKANSFLFSIDELTPAQAMARAKMYIEASRQVFEEFIKEGKVEIGAVYEKWFRTKGESCVDCLELAGLGWVPIGTLWTTPGAGDTQCLTHCGCYISYRNQAGRTLSTKEVIEFYLTEGTPFSVVHSPVGDIVAPGKLTMGIDSHLVRKLGSAKSGHYGHKGRPGQRGGSAPGGGGGLTQSSFAVGGGSATTGSVREYATENLVKSWDVKSEDLHQLAKEAGKPTEDRTDEEIKRDLVYGYLLGWAGRGGGPPEAQMVQAVCSDLGLEHDHSVREIPGEWLKEHPGIENALSSLGRAVYSDTQKWLKDRDISEIEVFRSGPVHESRLFSSWTLDWGGMRHEVNRPRYKAIVPISRVFSIPPTGFGTLAESEVVLLPRADLDIVYNQLSEEEVGIALPESNKGFYLEEYSGSMVALFPPKDLAEKLATEGGLPPEDLHITLATMGEAKGDPEDFVRIIKDYAKSTPPLSGRLNGIGRFSLEDKDAYILTVDIPILSMVREKLVQLLPEIEHTHGFTPHMTLAYIPHDAELPSERFEPIPVRFGTITLAWGNERFEFPLEGSAKLMEILSTAEVDDPIIYFASHTQEE